MLTTELNLEADIFKVFSPGIFCQGKPQSECSDHLGVSINIPWSILMAMNHPAEWNLKNVGELTHEAGKLLWLCEGKKKV